MKGKKARRNLNNAYIDDMAGEMDRLGDAGLPLDGTCISDNVQESYWIDLPRGTRCELIQSTLTVCVSGGVIAVLTYLTSEGYAEPVIIVDRFFSQLSDRGKRFILAHESGHLYYGHIGSPEDAVAAAGESIEGVAIKHRDVKCEYQADQYAAQINGKKDTIAAMKEIRRLMAKNRWLDFDVLELNQRIRHLMQTQVKAAA